MLNNTKKVIKEFINWKGIKFGMNLDVSGYCFHKDLVVSAQGGQCDRQGKH